VRLGATVSLNIQCLGKSGHNRKKERKKEKRKKERMTEINYLLAETRSLILHKCHVVWSD